MTDRLLLITGATGQQGGATIRALRAAGQPWRLRALVRNPDAPAARALAGQGVEVVRGDLDDEASVRRAVAGAYGVYSVQTPMGHGVEGEERQGKRLATLAAEAKVAHFVYSSAGGAERNSGVPHFESKWRIEAHMRALGLPATVLRPVAFMDNFAPLAFRTVMLSMMRLYVPATRSLQLVATRDVGVFAARAFNDPARHLGQAIELAGDEVTRAQMVGALRRAGLRPAVALPLPAFLRGRVPEDYRAMFAWFAGPSFQADIPALRATHPGLQTLEDWAAVAAVPHPRASGAALRPAAQ